MKPTVENVLTLSNQVGSAANQIVAALFEQKTGGINVEITDDENDKVYVLAINTYEKPGLKPEDVKEKVEKAEVDNEQE